MPAIKTPMLARLAREPAAGDETLVFDQAVSGWMPGDRVVLPDTRQLRGNGSQLPAAE
jgi:hypothetical protein